MHSVWRPPYPSENAKTLRVKTFSTTNPYAELQQPPQWNLNQPQLQSQLQLQQQPQSQLQSQPQLQQQQSKREGNNDKIYEHGLIPQVGMNPFLQGNYLRDLETQDQFLKPMNSNVSSTKPS